jgi:hypothetical protein
MFPSDLRVGSLKTDRVSPTLTPVWASSSGPELVTPEVVLGPDSRLICKQRPDLCQCRQMSQITPLSPLGISLKYMIVFQEP